MKKILFIIVAILLLVGCSDKTNEKIEEEPIQENDTANNETTDEPEVEQEDIEPIEVTVTVETIFDEDGKVHFTGETNLPDYAELMFTVSGPEGYTAQTKETVSGGVFETESFSKNGEALPKGEYELSVVLPVASAQDEEFLEIAGENYENLTGPLMEQSDGSFTMKYNTSFIVEKEVKKEYISSEEAKEIIEYHAIGKQDKLSNVEVVDGEIKATIEFDRGDMFILEDLVVVTYSGLAEELLYREDWEILTIEFVGAGTISMHRNEKESNEYGDYFPTLLIEERLK